MICFEKMLKQTSSKFVMILKDKSKTSGNSTDQEMSENLTKIKLVQHTASVTLLLVGFGNLTVKFNLLSCLFWVYDFVVVAFGYFQILI